MSFYSSRPSTYICTASLTFVQAPLPTTWLYTDQVVHEHEVVPQLLMHEVEISRLKRKLADTEMELQEVLIDVGMLLRNITRRVELLERAHS